MNKKYNETKKKIISALQELGYKPHSGIGNDFMEKKLYQDKELYGLIGYSCSDHGISLEWDLMLKGDNNAMQYIACEEFYIPLAFQLDKHAKIIFRSILTWASNQTVFSWQFQDFDTMIGFVKKADLYFLERYKSIERIIEDIFASRQQLKELYEKNGKVYSKNNECYFWESTTLVYIMFDMQNQAIESLTNAIECFQENIRYTNGGFAYCLESKKVYLEYLKNGTPLPYIPSPTDKASILALTGNDIYILLNKKNTKDSEILEYFGGIKNFNKAQKVSYEDVYDDGIMISKVGKWSILRVGVDLFLNFEQDKIESMLVELSAKYSRAILLINQDTSNTFGFEVYKKGEFLRRWMAGDGEVMENIGKPITGEKKRFMDILKDEQDSNSVVEFLDGILKITYGDLEKSKSMFYLSK